MGHYRDAKEETDRNHPTRCDHCGGPIRVGDPVATIGPDGAGTWPVAGFHGAIVHPECR